MLAYRQAFASSVVKKYLTLFKHKWGRCVLHRNIAFKPTIRGLSKLRQSVAQSNWRNSLIFQYAPLTSGEYGVSLFVS